MTSKVLSYIFILLGLAILWMSTSRKAMAYLSDARDGVAWWSTYPCNHGDLVSMSYLDFVKKFNPDPDTFGYKRADYAGPKNTVFSSSLHHKQRLSKQRFLLLLIDTDVLVRAASVTDRNAFKELCLFRHDGEPHYRSRRSRQRHYLSYKFVAMEAAIIQYTHR